MRAGMRGSNMVPRVRRNWMCPLFRGSSGLRPFFPRCARRGRAAGSAICLFRNILFPGHRRGNHRRRGNLGCQPESDALDLPLLRCLRNRCLSIGGSPRRSGSRRRLRPIRTCIGCRRLRCRLQRRRRDHGRRVRKRADCERLRTNGPDSGRVCLRSHHRSGRNLIQHPQRPGNDEQHESGNDAPEQLQVLARSMTACCGVLLLGPSHFAALPRLALMEDISPPKTGSCDACVYYAKSSRRLVLNRGRRRFLCVPFGVLGMP